MRKRFSAAMALALSCAMVLTACSGGSKPAETTAAATEASKAEETSAEETTAEAADEAGELGGTFTVGFDQDFPPMGFVGDDGEYTGFDLELAKEVADRLGLEFVPQPIAWDAKDMELSSGTIDCIWNGFTMTGREDEYTFSKPYVDNSIVYVVRADSDIQTEADLAGKHVITQAGSSALSALQDESKADVVNSFASLDEIADYNTAFMNLEAGTNDAIAVDIGVAQYQLTTKADKFRMLEEPLSTEQYAIGFKKGNEELRDQVQATLDEMAEDGTLAEIAAKYKDYNLDQMLCLGK